MPVEAQAAGVPVIAYGVGGAAETVLDGRTGVLFAEQSATALAAAIERFEGLGLGCSGRARERAALRPRALPRGDGGGDRPGLRDARQAVVCPTVQEVLPGVFHWTAPHPRIGVEVSSYWLDGSGVLFDPLVPPRAGLEWFAERAVTPVAILLSNRHHYRESGRFAERFGCSVHCNRAGLHEFSHGEAVQGFDLGEELPGGVLACELGAICPDDTALHLTEERALVIADGVVRGGPYGQSARSASSRTR